jgi:uncharacterized protein YdhG (YjbR/CyaY superfamily)
MRKMAQGLVANVTHLGVTGVMRNPNQAALEIILVVPAHSGVQSEERGFIMDTKKGQPATIDEYIARYPEDVQQVLVKIRAVIKEAAPEAVEKISYQMPGFYLNGSLVWFGVHTHHIGFYPTGSGIEAFKDELAGYKVSKGAVQFPLDAPMPYELIARIVKFKVAENLKKLGDV